MDKPRAKPLVWEDFDGRGAKAAAWRKANYLITGRSDGRFQVVESYPGYQGDNIGAGFYPTLEAAKAAAQADYEARILAALEAAPVSVPLGAVNALASYQQADEDGIMVLVSRQALEECLPALRALAGDEGER